MPELPEVETVRRGLVRAKLCAPVQSVWRSEFDLRIGEYWARKTEHTAKLKGLHPQEIARRGKYLLWTFQSEDESQEPWVMVLHLGMSGALELRRKGEKKAPHTHLCLLFGDGRRVDYVDPRRFGGFRVDRGAAHEQGPLGALGPEPLSPSFSALALHSSLVRRRIAIRDALLNQKIVAGVGNIYAVEALFESGISPLRPANAVTMAECERLVSAIANKLARAIELGGTTLRDYRGPNGERGRNQLQLAVYGREDESCPRCESKIQRVALGGRSAFYCPQCQLL